MGALGGQRGLTQLISLRPGCIFRAVWKCMGCLVQVVSFLSQKVCKQRAKGPPAYLHRFPFYRLQPGSGCRERDAIRGSFSTRLPKSWGAVSSYYELLYLRLEHPSSCGE